MKAPQSAPGRNDQDDDEDHDDGDWIRQVFDLQGNYSPFRVEFV